MATAPIMADDELPVGDLSRTIFGRVAVRVLLAAGGFVTFAFVTKEVGGLYAHVPWHDDPYDAVVSLALFFVPIVSLIGCVRLPLWRRDRPLPISRIQAVLRGARVAMAAMVITILTDWVSLALRANAAAWDTTTIGSVGLLALVTTLVLTVAFDLHRAWTRIPVLPTQAPDSDWFADVSLVGEQFLRGPLRMMALGPMRSFDRHVLPIARHHPIATAAAAAMGFGLALAASSFVEEGFGPLVWLDVGVGASAMFAFLVAAGSYVDLVRVVRPMTGRSRRALDAAVIGCAVVPVTLAFRDWLWWIVGANGGDVGPLALVELLAVVAVATFVLVFCVEALMGSMHNPVPCTTPPPDVPGP
jgi:uncharacterized membrane protein